MTRLAFSDYTVRLREFIRRGSALDNASGGPSAPEMEQVFNELALRLFELQFASNLPYRRFCQARGASPAGVAHWSQIPAIPTSAFKELEFTSLAPGERMAVFHSSGTTEERPSRHFHSAESLAVYEASLLPWFRAHLMADGGEVPVSMVFLTPPPALAPHSSLVYMFEAVRREFSAPGSFFAGQTDAGGAWVLDAERTRGELARAAEAKQAVVLLGTAFSFVHLLDDLAERNLRFELPLGSRILETGGYKGRSRVMPKSELHSLLTDRLGVSPERIICEYGMSELSSQAYDGRIQSPESRVQNSPRVFRFPPWARVEVISPETGRPVGEGETGLIRVFDLANVASVMAIQTEDLGVRRGAGFELLGRAKLAEPKGCSLLVA